MEYPNVKEIPVKIVGSIDNLKKQYLADEEEIESIGRLRTEDVKVQLEKAIEPLLNQTRMSALHPERSRWKDTNNSSEISDIPSEIKVHLESPLKSYIDPSSVVLQEIKANVKPISKSVTSPSKDRKRPDYLCSRCKQPKKGHVCPYPSKKKRKEGEMEEDKGEKKAKVGSQESAFKETNSQSESLPSSQESGSQKEVFKFECAIKSKEEQPESCKWVGMPLKVIQGIVYYSQLEYGDRRYNVGEYAYFQAKQANISPYIGRIINMWQRKECVASNDMFVHVLWFYRQTDVNRITKSHPQEVFMGKNIDQVSIHCLLGKCEVITLEEFNNRAGRTEVAPEDSYFCQSLYHDQEIMPLRQIGNFGHTLLPTNVEISDEDIQKMITIQNVGLVEEVQSSAVRKERPAARKSIVHNWSSNIQYTRKLLGWNELPVNVKMGLNTQAENYRLSFEIQKIEDKDHPCYGDYGLFAKRDIKKHKILGEYCGSLQLSSGEGVNKKFLANLYKGTKIAVDINSELNGNEFRFLNDYRGTGKAKPNVKLESTALSGEWRLFVISIQNIPRGKELLVDYEAEM